MVTSTLAPELAADWKLDTPAGTEAFRRRNLWLDQLSRTLLADWRDDDPTERAVSRLLADLDKWAENNTEYPPPPHDGPP